MKRSSRGVFDNETLRDIGARIREARGDRTQEEFSKIIGVGRTVLANYEAGRRLPDSVTLDKISENSNISVNYILSGMEATIDPFNVTEKFPDTYFQEGYAAALFVFEKMRGAFSNKSETEKLMIWGNIIPKLAEHLDIVIGQNVAINNSNFDEELKAIIDEFRIAERSDMLELIVEMNATSERQ